MNLLSEVSSIRSQGIKFFLPILYLFSLSACTDYWWSRGQAPSVAKQIQHSQVLLSESIASFGKDREDLAQISTRTERALLSLVDSIENHNSPDALQAKLAIVRTEFIGLEGILSVTSRAAYGELSAQLRNFTEEKHGLHYTSFGLFTARTISFLASELSLPKPI